jgi:hypothetical protein
MEPRTVNAGGLLVVPVTDKSKLEEIAERVDEAVDAEGQTEA